MIKVGTNLVVVEQGSELAQTDDELVEHLLQLKMAGH